MKIARPIAGSPVYAPTTRPVYRGGGNGGGGTDLGVLAFSDTFQDTTGTSILSHTPDFDLVGDGWVNFKLGAFSTLNHAINENSLYPTGTNANCNGANIGALPNAAQFDILFEGTPATGNETQFLIEKIDTNGYARMLSLRVSTTSLLIKWGNNNAGATDTTWDSETGAWSVPIASILNSVQPVSILMDRTSDLAQVTFYGETRYFDLRSGTYTYYDGSATRFGILSKNSPYRRVYNVKAYK